MCVSNSFNDLFFILYRFLSIFLKPIWSIAFFFLNSVYTFHLFLGFFFICLLTIYIYIYILYNLLGLCVLRTIKFGVCLQFICRLHGDEKNMLRLPYGITPTANQVPPQKKIDAPCSCLDYGLKFPCSCGVVGS